MKVSVESHLKTLGNILMKSIQSSKVSYQWMLIYPNDVRRKRCNKNLGSTRRCHTSCVLGKRINDQKPNEKLQVENKFL